MTKVEIVGGKVKVTKTAKSNSKPKKYPFSANQYDELLKLAKQSGIDVGDTKAVNAVVKAVIDDFLAQQQQQQTKPKTQ